VRQDNALEDTFVTSVRSSLDVEHALKGSGRLRRGPDKQREDGDRLEVVAAVAMVAALVLLLLLGTSVISYDTIFLPVLVGVPISVCGLLGLVFVETGALRLPARTGRSRLTLVATRLALALVLGGVVAAPWLVQATESAVVEKLRADYVDRVPAMRELNDRVSTAEADLAQLAGPREQARRLVEQKRAEYVDAYDAVTSGTESAQARRAQIADRLREQWQAAQMAYDSLDAAWRESSDKLDAERAEAARLDASLRSAPREEIRPGAGGEISALEQVVSWPVALAAMVAFLVPGLLVTLLVRTGQRGTVARWKRPESSRP